MIGVGISYMIMGSLFFLSKKLKLNFNFISLRIYLLLFASGCFITLLSIFKFLIPNYIYMILCTVAVFCSPFYSLNMIKKLINSVNILNKLTK